MTELNSINNNNNNNNNNNQNANSWTNLLQHNITTGKQKSTKEQEEEATKLFMDIVNEEKERESKEAGNIPRFFYKKPTNFNNDMYLSVKSEAKQKYLILKSYDLPQKKNLKDLWLLLKENISPPKDGNERINYRDFKKISKNIPYFKDYFRASLFLRFDRDKHGRIEILTFFHYVVRKNNIQENKINLSLNDYYCEGFLIDKDLENYIKKEIQNFPFYSEISEDIKEYYLLVAQRKFFFFLDPKRTGKIYINDIVTSSYLAEFLEMSDKNLANSPQEAALNWFSLHNFWRIYKKYVELDKDKNGMLSKEELIKFGPGLTSIFIDRVFEEYQKYENAIDFKQFIDFVLAMENRKEPASIQFIWRAIDVYHKNAVDTFVINMFYRAVVKKLINRDQGEYRIDDIKDEIWDMIKPKNPNYITLQDVLNSSYSDLVLSLLIDAKAFYQHDKKEYPFIEEFQELDEDYV